jgi:hypothetical protein
MPLALNAMIFRGLWSQSQSYVKPNSQSASLSWCQAPIRGPRPNCYYCQTVAGLLMCSFCDKETSLSLPLPAQSFTGPSPAGLMTIFYCLGFETPHPGGPGSLIYNSQVQVGPVITLSLFVTSYDLQSYSLGIQTASTWRQLKLLSESKSK